MNGKGIMRRARLAYLAPALLLVVAPVFAQAPTSDEGDDLDVTMHVIVDPNAKVPDQIVRKIPLPKPVQPVAPGKPDEKPKDPGKPADAAKPTPPDTGKPTDTPGKPAAQAAPDIREQGRAFGQQVSEEAKERSEEARRNNKPPAPPGNPDRPPKGPRPRPPD
jgi:hypothetical protein